MSLAAGQRVRIDLPGYSGARVIGPVDPALLPAPEAVMRAEGWGPFWVVELIGRGRTAIVAEDKLVPLED